MYKREMQTKLQELAKHKTLIVLSRFEFNGTIGGKLTVPCATCPSKTDGNVIWCASLQVHKSNNHINNKL